MAVVTMTAGPLGVSDMLAYLEALCALLPGFQLSLVGLVDLEALCALLPVFQLSLIDLVRLTPGGCRGTRRQACRARQAVLSRWVLLWWRAQLRLGGGHPRLEVLDQRRAKRLLGTFVDAESFSEVALAEMSKEFG